MTKKSKARQRMTLKQMRQALQEKYESLEKADRPFFMELIEKLTNG